MKISGPLLTMLLLIAWSVGFFPGFFIRGGIERYMRGKESSTEAEITIKQKGVSIVSQAAAEIDPLAEIKPLLEAKREELVNIREPLIAHVQELFTLCQQSEPLNNYLEGAAEILWLDKKKTIGVKWMSGRLRFHCSKLSKSIIDYVSEIRGLKLKDLQYLASLDLNTMKKTLREQLED